MSEIKRIVHFSNAILDGYLKFVAQYQKGARFQDFLNKLGVDEGWLRDHNAWHDAKFNDRFFAVLREVFPEHKDIAFQGARFLYLNNKFQRFTSLAGLLIQPKLIFSKLPAASARMNLYNTYEFRMELEMLAYSRGRLVQHYPPGEMPELHASLCDAARGSIIGILEYLGHTIVDFEEPVCVKHGADHCEYVITWMHRPFLRRGLLWAGLSGLLSLLAIRLLGTPASSTLAICGALSSIPFLLFSAAHDRKSLQAAFDFQQQTLVDLRNINDAKDTLTQKLLDYQKQLASALEVAAIGEMSFSFVHDMATPTTMLMACSKELNGSVASRIGLSEKAIAKYTRTIDRATARLITLQEMFRTMVRGQMSTQATSVDVSQVVAGALEMFWPFLERYGIAVDVKGKETPHVITTYEGCVEGVILNLMQNALHALTAVENRKLSITLDTTDTHVRFTFADTGPGLPPEHLQNMWQRFGPSSRSPGGSQRSAAIPISGSGFGLYNIKKLVDKMHGQIELKSDASGTMFTVLFPITLAGQGDTSAAGA